MHSVGDPRKWWEWRWPAALLTAAAVLGAGLLRHDLVGDSRFGWVAGFAACAGLLAALLPARARWTCSVFLVAVGIGIVLGLHYHPPQGGLSP